MIIHAYAFDYTGYGRLACDVLSFFPHAKVVSEDPLPEHLRSREGKGVPHFSISPPYYKGDAKVQYTMYESDRLNRVYLPNLQKRKCIITTCAQNKSIFTREGLTNVFAVNPGCRPNYLFPAQNTPFTFLHVANDSLVPERKRSQDVIDAFSRAFPAQKDVRLIVKKTPACFPVYTFDSRVTIIKEWSTKEQMAALNQSAHVGIFLSGQEAWGYPLVELMEIGRPVIAIPFCGPAEYLNASNGYPLPYKLIPTPIPFYQKTGKCAYAKLDDLISVMRFCYENPEDTVLKGVQAYRTMLGFTMNRMAMELCNVLKNLAKRK